MGLFKKIGQMLSGEKETNVPSPVVEDNKEKSKELKNAVDQRNRIKKSLLATMDSLYLSNTKACKGKQLTLWLDTDNLTFQAYSDFGEELVSYLAIERDYRVADIFLKQGHPDHTEACVHLDSSGLPFAMALQQREDTFVVTATKAVVSVFEGKGSLLQEHYELSSGQLNENKRFFNIGRGALVTLDGGRYRHNDIAIDDVNHLDTNRYVSRAHARIGFSELVGFYLQVETGGSRLSGNRTRVFRNEEIIEVENTAVKVPLHDGDLIELGKAVLLKFTLC